MIKICTNCSKEFNTSDRSLRCSRKCLSESRRKLLKERYIRRKPYLNKQSKEWKLKNPDKTKAQSYKWRASHLEKSNKIGRDWRKRNPEKTRDSYRKWASKNPGYLSANRQNRRSRMRNAVGSFTVGEWELLKLQYNFTCPSCLKIEPIIKLSVDHIIPLSKGGSNNIENIQPLCRSCNCRKHVKIIKY